MLSRLQFRFAACTAAFLVAVAIGAAPAKAGNAKVGRIEIENAWTHATSWDSFRDAAFLTLVNHGDRNDALIEAAAPTVAKRTRLARFVVHDGTMSLPTLADIPIPAHKTIGIAPGGYHVMLEGLKTQLKKGSHFPLTLTFRHAGTVTVSVEVAGPSFVH